MKLFKSITLFLFLFFVVSAKSQNFEYPAPEKLTNTIWESNAGTYSGISSLKMRFSFVSDSRLKVTWFFEKDYQNFIIEFTELSVYQYSKGNGTFHISCSFENAIVRSEGIAIKLACEPKAKEFINLINLQKDASFVEKTLIMDIDFILKNRVIYMDGVEFYQK